MQACEPVCRIDRQWKWSPHVVQSWCQASNKRWAKSIAKPSRKTHSRNPTTTSVESNLHKFWRTCQGASSPCITGASQSLQRWSRNPHTTTKKFSYCSVASWWTCKNFDFSVTVRRTQLGANLKVFFWEFRPNHRVTEMQANWYQSFGLEFSFSWYLEWNLSVGEKRWCELDVILVEVRILRRSWSVHWQEVETDPEFHRASVAGIVLSDVLVRSCGLLRRP